MLHNIISCETILYITIPYEIVSYDTIIRNTALYFYMSISIALMIMKKKIKPLNFVSVS